MAGIWNGLGGLGLGGSVGQAALAWITAGSPNANQNGVVGQITAWDISTLTADRDFILPDTARVNDRVAVALTVGDATYDVNIKTAASGSLINGVDASSTPWATLVHTGSMVTFRCVKAGGAGDTDWFVESKTIPQEITTEISSETLGSDTTFASVTIPPGYHAIDVEFYVESDRSANLDDILMTINSDTTDANYTRYRSYVTGSSSTTGGNAEDRSVGIVPAANLTGELGLTKLELRGVSDTGVNTHWSCVGGGAGAASNSSGEWSSTAAITSLSFDPGLGTNFKSGSKLTVYGKRYL